MKIKFYTADEVWQIITEVLPLSSTADTDEEFSEYDYENETFANTFAINKREEIVLSKQN